MSSTASNRFGGELQRKGRPGAQAKELLRQIGDVIVTQHRMVGRVEVEKRSPMNYADHPELKHLYARLEDKNTSWWSAAVR